MDVMLWVTILCVMTMQVSSATIKRSIKINLTPDQQRIIVDTHNELRRLEGAADMNTIVKYCHI